MARSDEDHRAIMEVRDRIQETTTPESPLPSTTLFSIASLISSSQRRFPTARSPLEFPFPPLDMRAYYESMLQRSFGTDRVLDLSTSSQQMIAVDRREDDSRGKNIDLVALSSPRIAIVGSRARAQFAYQIRSRGLLEKSSERIDRLQRTCPLFFS